MLGPDTACDTRKRATVVGIGDIWMGDHGVGAYIIDALAQEHAGRANVECAWLAMECWKTGVCLALADVGFVAHGACLGRRPGEVSVVDMNAYAKLCAPCRGEGNMTSAALDSIARTAMLGCMPRTLRFVLVEVACSEGVSLSRAARLGVRKAASTISSQLAREGVTPSRSSKVSRMYRIPGLQSMV